MAVILLLMCALLCLLPFTASGTKGLLAIVERTGIIHARYSEGTLFGDLRLERLSIATGSMSMQASNLHSRLDPGCFWSSIFCLDLLHAQFLSVEISDSDSSDNLSSQEMLQLPWAYDIADLHLQELQVHWPGGRWVQGALRASAFIAGERVEVSQAVAERPQLLLDDTAASSTDEQGFVPGSIFMPLNLRVGRLQLQQPGIVAGSDRRQFQSLEVSGRWRGFALQVQEVTLSAEALGEVAARGSLQFDEYWPLKFDADIALDDRIEQEALRGRHLQGQVQGDLRQLQFSLEAPGAATLGLRGEVELLATGYPFRVEGALSASPELMMGYQTLSLTTRGHWQAPRLIVESLTLDDEASESHIQASGELLLDQDWSVAARASSSGWELPALPGWPGGSRVRGDIALKAGGDEGHWRVQVPAVDLKGEVAGQPASLAGHGGLDSSLRLMPGQWRADVNGARLAVDVSEDSEQAAKLSLALEDLGRWLGGARGSLQLNGQGRLQSGRLALAGAASGLDFNGIQVPKASLSLDYALQDEEGQLALSIPTLSANGYQLDEVVLSLQGSVDDHRLRLSSTGGISGELAVDGERQEGRWQGSLQPTRLGTRSGDWALSTPLALSWQEQPQGLAVAEHCWQHVDFELCAGESLVGAKGVIDLQLTGDVEAFNGLLPASLSAAGTLNADVAVAWAEHAPLEVNGTVAARQLTVTRRYGLGERVSVTWESVNVSADRTGSGIALRAEAVNGGRRVAFLDALLPEAATGPVSGRLVMEQLQLSTLSPWVTELAVLEGSLSGNLELAGTASDLSARGRLQLSEGHLVVEGNPTELTHLALDLELDGKRGQLQGSGLFGGGDIEFTGEILARPELRLDLAITGGRHQVLVPPASEMLVSEQLTLVFTQGLLEVRGDVRVHEGVLRHEELPEGSVAISQDVVQVDLQGNVLASKHPFDVRADIWLRLRDRFRIEGETLRATLGGDLHLLQEPGQALEVFGSLNLQGGELFAYRQHLQVRRGTVAFSGPADNPDLDVAAEREIRGEGITVGARLRGPLLEPTLEIYSDPVMSQGEAMSYLVRGRGLDSGAAADGTALALSLGADIVNRSGIVAEINRLPLISDVSFGASGSEEDTAATVSGYIGSRLYLSYGIGLYEPINVLTARLYLQSRLWLEVVSALENSVDLYYSFDID